MTWGFDLNVLANAVILISAVIIAIKNIYGFFKAPVGTLQKKAKEEEKKRIEQVLDEKMPDLLGKNCETIMGSLKEISNQLKLLNASQLDMLRYNMNKLYYKYRPYKRILSADKKAFIKLYNDYKHMDGNTWIDALYAEVITWQIVEDESELSENGKT